MQECDLDNRRRLYEQVVVSGGSTLFPGLPSRLEAELRRLYLTNVLQVWWCGRVWGGQRRFYLTNVLQVWWCGRVWVGQRRLYLTNVLQVRGMVGW